MSAHSKQLPALQVQDAVAIQDQTGHTPRRWSKTGTVVEVLPHDSYVVKVDGSNRVTKRNRQFLRKLGLYQADKDTFDPLPPLPTLPAPVIDAPDQLEDLPHRDTPDQQEGQPGGQDTTPHTIPESHEENVGTSPTPPDPPPHPQSDSGDLPNLEPAMPSPPPITLKRRKGRWFVNPDLIIIIMANKSHQQNAMHASHTPSARKKNNMWLSRKDSPLLTRSQIVTLFRLLLNSLR